MSGAEMEIHGPDVTIEQTFIEGRRLARLLNAIAESLGAPPGAIGWRCVGAEFQCDGCGLRRPDRPRPGDGWTYRDGDDFCPECSADSETEPT